MLRNLFIVLVVAISAVIAIPSAYASRATDFASCNYILVPHVPVDPAMANLIAEFNFILGHALAVADSLNPINILYLTIAMTIYDTNGVDPLQNPGVTFTEGPDGDFFVANQLSAGGWTCTQTKAFMESLAGSDQLGPSGVTWSIESSKCTCPN